LQLILRKLETEFMSWATPSVDEDSSQRHLAAIAQSWVLMAWERMAGWLPVCRRGRI